MVRPVFQIKAHVNACQFMQFLAFVRQIQCPVLRSSSGTSVTSVIRREIHVFDFFDFGLDQRSMSYSLGHGYVQNMMKKHTVNFELCVFSYGCIVKGHFGKCFFEFIDIILLFQEQDIQIGLLGKNYLIDVLQTQKY